MDSAHFEASARLQKQFRHGFSFRLLMRPALIFRTIKTITTMITIIALMY